MFVITGGGSGIGKALAHALAERDKDVLIIGRREENLRATTINYPSIQFLSADVSTDSGRLKIIKYLQATCSIDGLIHSAGTIDPVARLGNINEQEWRDSFSTNVEAPLFLTQQLKNKLANGRVLQIGSGAAYFPIAGWSAYCASKAAFAMIAKCWQEENGLSVASVMPGIVDTELLAHGYSDIEQMNLDKYEFYKGLCQENKLLETKTVALFLSWLLLDIKIDRFVSQEWDIYDVSHHQEWLDSEHKLPQWQEPQ